VGDAPPPETVGGLLIDGEGRILLGLRAPWKRAWPDCWDVVGGHVEAGETLEAALTRELREEIGVTPTSVRWLASADEPRPDRHGAARHHMFAVDAWQGEPANLCDEHVEIRWFSSAQARALPNLVSMDFPALIDRALATRT
jgi:8-oxo-dGTP pyrophosphatase MutT (NUDIX family)